MKNNEILKRQIIYRSTHRGNKEMDLLLGNFVKKFINTFNNKELKELDFLLSVDDEILYKWYFNKKKSELIPQNTITKKLRQFKLH